jgi:hypothetical protein
MNRYLWNVSGNIVIHTDLGEAKRLDGLENPDLTVTEEQWDAAGGQAYLTSQGKIKLGESTAQAQARILAGRNAKIDKQLEEIDLKSIRPARAVSAALASGSTPDESDVTRLSELKAQSDALRAERNAPLA